MDTETKTVYGYDADGKYTQALLLDRTDRSQHSGAWQYPANTTETAPPKDKDGYDRVYKTGAWTYVEQAKEDKPEPPTDPGSPSVQDHEYVDPDTLALADAVLGLSERLEKLEGGTAQ